MFSVPIPDHAIQIGPGAKKKCWFFLNTRWSGARLGRKTFSNAVEWLGLRAGAHQSLYSDEWPSRPNGPRFHAVLIFAILWFYMLEGNAIPLGLSKITNVNQYD